MTLYLIQHGEAKSEAEDPERSLTPEGENEVTAVSKMAGRLHLRPSRVFHSGKVRARQTAEIVAQGLGIPGDQVEEAKGLNPNDEVHPWADRLSSGKEDLLLVGHLPFLEKLTSLLLCGDEQARLVLFRNAGIVCLEQKRDQGWAIRWILTPEMP